MTPGIVAVEPLDRSPDAVIRPPGSKSLTNRALVVAALAEGPSRLHRILHADDTDAMIGALRALGCTIDIDGDGVVVGGRAPVPDRVTIDARLSGTTARFLLPLAALGGSEVIVDGQAGLRRRPIGPLLDALSTLGAEIEARGEPGHLPLRIDGRRLHGGHVRVDASDSSQFLSALLLAAPGFVDGLEVEATGDIVARPFVDMTVSVLRSFGAEVSEPSTGTFVVAPGGLRGTEQTIEADATAASYFLAAAAITGGRVRVEGVGAGSFQGDVGFARVLAEMGAAVEVLDGAITLEGGPLRGIDVDCSAMPDTAQTLAVVAAFAQGETRVRGIGFTRGHETDRPAAVVTELRRIGADATETGDGFQVVPGPLHGATIQTYGDHRMAMSFALVGLRVPGIRIADPDVVAKTYPDFFSDLERFGVPSGATR